MLQLITFQFNPTGDCKIPVFLVYIYIVLCYSRDSDESSAGEQLILRLTCPGCKKDSYSASVESYKPCPYCGILYSGKYGIEKRNEFRLQKDTPIVFSYRGKNLEARTQNFSETGVCLEVEGKPSLTIGDIMEINFGDSLLNARIMWVFYHPEKTSALTGLQLLNGNLKIFG